MGHRLDETDPGLAEIREMYAAFAAEFPQLTLYRQICEHAAGDDEIASLLLAARPGQARPVLFLAALHDLVLAQPELPAARWYASVVGRDQVPEADPWPEIRATALDHADHLREVIASRATQTNEVNRVIYLAALLAAATADLPELPVSLVELGASAGLLLGIDRYRLDLATDSGPLVLGDPAAAVHCAGEVKGNPPWPLRLPEIAGRSGIDLDPIAVTDADALRWLEACIWPDVPGRVERFIAAADLLRADPPPLVAGDLVDELSLACRAADPDLDDRSSHLVVFSSWALTYVDRARRQGVAQALERQAADRRPVTWISAEPQGCVPDLPTDDGHADGTTVLGMHRWRNGIRLPGVVLGTAHPHGEWVDLTG